MSGASSGTGTGAANGMPGPRSAGSLRCTAASAPLSTCSSQDGDWPVDTARSQVCVLISPVYMASAAAPGRTPNGRVISSPRTAGSAHALSMSRIAAPAASAQPSSGTSVTRGAWPIAGAPEAIDVTRRNTASR
jgi:hypothetical protein